MILALDASSATGSVALVKNGDIVREITVLTPRGRGGALFTALQEILADCPVLQRVVVGTGPGSYNGIRSAIAAAWGIATARDIAVVGLSSLLGLGEGKYAAVGDARRGQFYFASIARGTFLSEPALYEKGELIGRLGSDPVYVPEAIDWLPSAIVRGTSAARLACLGAEIVPAASGLEPLYLKPAHITTPGKGKTQICSAE